MSCNRYFSLLHVSRRNEGLTSATAQPHPHGQFDDSQEYKIRAIIAENSTHYYIEWGDDEVTGEKWGSTWEPKGNANRLAIEDWEETKRKRRMCSFSRSVL